jgi:hypothetical protein
MAMCNDGVIISNAKCEAVVASEPVQSNIERIPGLVNPTDALAGLQTAMPGRKFSNVEVKQEVQVQMTIPYTAAQLQSPQTRIQLQNSIAKAAGIDCLAAGVDCLALVQIDWASMGVDISGRRLNVARRQLQLTTAVTIKNPPGRSLDASTVTDSTALVSALAREGVQGVQISRTPSVVTEIVSSVETSTGVSAAVNGQSVAAAIAQVQQTACDSSGATTCPGKVNTADLSVVGVTTASPSPAPAGGLVGRGGAVVKSTVIHDDDEDGYVAVIVAESIVVGVLLVALVLLCRRNSANKPSGSNNPVPA